jgi:hypothetical protein
MGTHYIVGGPTGLPNALKGLRMEPKRVPGGLQKAPPGGIQKGSKHALSPMGKLGTLWDYTWWTFYIPSGTLLGSVAALFEHLVTSRAPHSVIGARSELK